MSIVNIHREYPSVSSDTIFSNLSFADNSALSGDNGSGVLMIEAIK